MENYPYQKRKRITKGNSESQVDNKNVESILNKPQTKGGKDKGIRVSKAK
jgi:hypothetical protein